MSIKRAVSNLESAKTGIEAALSALTAPSGAETSKVEAAKVGVELAEESIAWVKTHLSSAA